MTLVTVIYVKIAIRSLLLETPGGNSGPTHRSSSARFALLMIRGFFSSERGLPISWFHASLIHFRILRYFDGEVFSEWISPQAEHIKWLVQMADCRYPHCEHFHTRKPNKAPPIAAGTLTINNECTPVNSSATIPANPSHSKSCDIFNRIGVMCRSNIDAMPNMSRSDRILAGGRLTTQPRAMRHGDSIDYRRTRWNQLRRWNAGIEAVSRDTMQP